MASASKTPNLNLPQWVETEKPERTDFNAAFDAIDTTVASHLAESVSEVIGATRDMSIEGVQTISTTVNKSIKSIIGFGQVSNTGKFSIFVADKNDARGTYTASNTDDYNHSSTGFVVADSTANRMIGHIQNLQKGSFDIYWEKVGSPGAGSFSMKFLIMYHGE